MTQTPVLRHCLATAEVTFLSAFLGFMLSFELGKDYCAPQMATTAKEEIHAGITCSAHQKGLGPRLSPHLTICISIKEGFVKDLQSTCFLVFC